MKHTGGKWKQGDGGCVVSDSKDGLIVPGSFSEDSLKYYGGYLICESVSDNNIPLITAAPDMLKSLKKLASQLAKSTDYLDHIFEVRKMVDEAFEIIQAAEPAYHKLSEQGVNIQDIVELEIEGKTYYMDKGQYEKMKKFFKS